jgi:hypothetical protein
MCGGYQSAFMVHAAAVGADAFDDGDDVLVVPAFSSFLHALSNVAILGWHVELVGPHRSLTGIVRV